MPAKSWKTTTLGIITILLAVIHAVQDYVQNGTPPNLFTLGAAITGGWGLIHAKDANVTNASVVGVATKVVSVFLVMTLLWCLAGCVTDATTGKQRLMTNAELSADWTKFQDNPNVKTAERAAGRITIDFLVAAAETKVSGGKFDKSWAINTGMNSIADVVPTMANDQAAVLIANTAQNFAQDSSMKPMGQKLAAAFVAANPKTPAERKAVVVALGMGVANGTTVAATSLP